MKCEKTREEALTRREAREFASFAKRAIEEVEESSEDMFHPGDALEDLYDSFYGAAPGGGAGHDAVKRLVRLFPEYEEMIKLATEVLSSKLENDQTAWGRFWGKIAAVVATAGRGANLLPEDTGEGGGSSATPSTGGAKEEEEEFGDGGGAKGEELDDAFDWEPPLLRAGRTKNGAGRTSHKQGAGRRPKNEKNIAFCPAFSAEQCNLRWETALHPEIDHSDLDERGKLVLKHVLDRYRARKAVAAEAGISMCDLVRRLRAEAEAEDGLLEKVKDVSRVSQGTNLMKASDWPRLAAEFDHLWHKKMRAIKKSVIRETAADILKMRRDLADAATMSDDDEQDAMNDEQFAGDMLVERYKVMEEKVQSWDEVGSVPWKGKKCSNLKQGYAPHCSMEMYVRPRVDVRGTRSC